MKKYWKYLVIFCFFWILFCFSPISGDDWGNYLVGSQGIRHSLGVALGMYFDWEGRFISRIFINILTYHKWLWNIVNALLITGGFFVINKNIGDKNKKFIFPLVVLIILGMNPFTFSQIITWLAGNITYFFVIPIILFYFYYLINNDKYNKWFFIVFCLINLLGTMFVENMALVLVLGNILLIIYKYFKTKKIDKRLILFLGLSVMTTILMLLSPGSRYRSTIENLEFNSLSFIGKIFYNIPNFIEYTFVINTYMLALLSVSSYFLIKNNFNNTIIKSILLIVMLFMPVVTMFIYPLSIVMNTGLNFLVDSRNIFVIFYWLLYLFVYLYLLIIDNKKELSSVLLFLVGLISNGVMLMSPTWGFRTSVFTYIVFCMVALIIINKYCKDMKSLVFGSYGLLVVGCLFYGVFYINIWRCQNNLENSIKKQLDANNDIIYIDEFPYIANCNINPTNDYHLRVFKSYYEIPEDKEVILVSGKWKYKIIYIG